MIDPRGREVASALPPRVLLMAVKLVVGDKLSENDTSHPTHQSSERRRGAEGGSQATPRTECYLSQDFRAFGADRGLTNSSKEKPGWNPSVAPSGTQTPENDNGRLDGRPNTVSFSAPGGIRTPGHRIRSSIGRTSFSYS